MLQDIWDYHKRSYYACIPINRQVKLDNSFSHNGCAIMGAGLALQAAKRFPELPKQLGRRLTKLPGYWAYMFHEFRLICLPTKEHWRDKARVDYIEKSLLALADWYDYSDVTAIVVPRLGCGLGGLDWEKEVKPLVTKYLGDYEHVVILD